MHSLATLKKFKERRLLQKTFHPLIVFLGFTALFTAFFSPILFSDKLLAPGDGIVYYIPALYSAKTLWTDLLFGGYPIAADPQNQAWYPLSFLFNSSTQLWNAYVVVAYVLAASFSYCYMYIVTRSRLAAIATGIIYSMSGYMMAHLGHLTMIHAAAWIPLILCAFETLRHRFDRAWFAIGVGAIACCFLSGHPQIPVYGIGMGAIYATCLGWTAPIGRWNYYKVALGMLVIGLGACALQVLPTLELSRLSLRAEMTFKAFSSYSVPPWQALQFIFPYLFVGPDSTGNPTLYWGEWGLTEIANYTGLLSLMLGAIGFVAYRSRPLAWFWLIAGVVTLLFTFGDGTPLGYVLYHIPVYKMFRAQGRHAVEVALAVSILAGFGVASVQQHTASKRLLLVTVGIGAGVILASLGIMALQHHQVAEKAAKVLQEPLDWTPWVNPSVGVPILIFLAAALALIIWSRSTQSSWRSLVLVGVLAIDLASFGWFYEWRTGVPPSNSWLTPPAFAQTYHQTLQAEHQRLLAPKGADALDSETIFPNLSRLWGVPGIGGYTPLALSRISEMMQMSASGSIPSFPLKAGDRSLDLMAVRYVFVPPPIMASHQGAFWGEDLGLALGTSSCAPEANESVKFTIPDLPNETSDIGFVTNLGCSTGILDKTDVLQVQVTGANGKVETHNLQAGRDTSEWAYDCPSIKPSIKHQQAKIFQTFSPQKDGTGSCSGHAYLSQISLKHPSKIKNLALKWIGQPGVMSIFHISLINKSQQTAAAFTRGGISRDLKDSPQWRYVENVGQTAVYENLRAMPRVWLVSEVINVKKKAAVLKTIRSSRLPDGRTFAPERTALVEKGGRSRKYADLQPNDLVKVDKISDTNVEIQTETASDAFLVLSDVYYPGWKATIDGKSTRIFRTNYLQRGIQIPKGRHSVKFEFRPTSFRLGVGISTASLFICGFLLLPRNLLRNRLLRNMRLTRET